MDLKVTALRTFVIVAENGNIQAAADRLGRSVSAISMTLKQLEQNLGGPLFESERKDRLTALGAYVLQTARDVVTRHDRAMAAIDAYATGRVGTLDLACVPSVATNLLPRLVRAFMETRPHLRVDIMDIDTGSVVRAIERGRVELGIAGRPGESDGVDFTPLFQDELVLVCPETDPLAAAGRGIHWRDLETRPFIASGVSAALTEPGAIAVHGRARLTVRNTTSLLALVRAGVGVTVLPNLSIPIDASGIASVRFDAPRPMRTVGLLKKAGATLSPIAEAFANVVGEAAAAVTAGGGVLRPPGASFGE